jgi:hypothetical protein
MPFTLIFQETTTIKIWETKERTYLFFFDTDNEEIPFENTLPLIPIFESGQCKVYRGE